jgi:hypothetical protein
MATQRQLRVEALLDRPQLQLDEPPHVHTRERLELEVGERSSTPQRLGLAYRSRRLVRFAALQRLPPLGHEPLEAMQVEVGGLDDQDVARGAGDERRGAVTGQRQCLAQARDLHREGVLRLGARLIRPKLLDQAVARDHAIRAQQQQREQSTASARRR